MVDIPPVDRMTIATRRFLASCFKVWLLGRTHISEARLVRVLADWCPKFSGYHLCYPGRRQTTPAFRVLVDALRYRR